MNTLLYVLFYITSRCSYISLVSRTLADIATSGRDTGMLISPKLAPTGRDTEQDN